MFGALVLWYFGSFDFEYKSADSTCFAIGSPAALVNEPNDISPLRLDDTFDQLFSFRSATR